MGEQRGQRSLPDTMRFRGYPGLAAALAELAITQRCSSAEVIRRTLLKAVEEIAYELKHDGTKFVVVKRRKAA